MKGRPTPGQVRVEIRHIQLSQGHAAVRLQPGKEELRLVPVLLKPRGSETRQAMASQLFIGGFAPLAGKSGCLGVSRRSQDPDRFTDPFRKRKTPETFEYRRRDLEPLGKQQPSIRSTNIFVGDHGNLDSCKRNGSCAHAKLGRLDVRQSGENRGRWVSA